MSDDEYTTSMDMLRRAYVSVNGPGAVYSRIADEDREVVGRNFDRAIAAHDAEVAARAWDEGVEAGVQASAEWWRGYEGPMTETNPYMKEAFDETDI